MAGAVIEAVLDVAGKARPAREAVAGVAPAHTSGLAVVGASGNGAILSQPAWTAHASAIIAVAVVVAVLGAHLLAAVIATISISTHTGGIFVAGALSRAVVGAGTLGTGGSLPVRTAVAGTIVAQAPVVAVIHAHL